MNIRTMPRGFVNLFIDDLDAVKIRDALVLARDLIKRELQQTTSQQLMDANEALYSVEFSLLIRLMPTPTIPVLGVGDEPWIQTFPFGLRT